MADDESETFMDTPEMTEKRLKRKLSSSKIEW